LRNSDRLAGTFRWSEDPSIAWLVLPPQKILLAENMFLQAGNGTENTKEKSRQCFAYVGKILGGYQVGRSMCMVGTELTTSVRYGTGIQ
jgi:hypothetical protein